MRVSKMVRTGGSTWSAAGSSHTSSHTRPLDALRPSKIAHEVPNKWIAKLRHSRTYSSQH